MVRARSRAFTPYANAYLSNPPLRTLSFARPKKTGLTAGCAMLYHIAEPPVMLMMKHCFFSLRLLAAVAGSAVMLTCAPCYAESTTAEPASAGAYSVDGLVEAAETGNVQLLNRMLAAGVSVDAHTTGMMPVTALMMAAYKGHADCVAALLKGGATVNLQTGNTAWSALMLAAEGGHTECMRLLSEAGADLNLQNSWGGTALMLAAMEGNADCVKFLLERGADAAIRSKSGDTALDIAETEHRQECAALLKTAVK